MIGGEDVWKLLKKPLLISLAVVLIAFCILFWFLGYKRGCKSVTPEIRTDTVKITKTYYKTQHHFDTITNIFYKPYPVPVHDTIYPEDTLQLNLPYIEGCASIPDTMDIYFHGWIDAGVDSVKYSLFHTTEIINQTIEVPKYVTPRVMIKTGLQGFYFDQPYAAVFGEIEYNKQFVSYSVFGGYGTNFDGLNKPFFGGSITFRLEIQ